MNTSAGYCRVSEPRVCELMLWLTLLALVLAGCAKSSQPSVVVYVSVDQVYAEPVFQAFEQKTGIRVDPVYDVEANKVTGLSNRLVAESRHPRAQVFWNGEFVQTIRLAAKGIFQRYQSPSATALPAELVDPNHLWTGATPRFRVWMSSLRFKATDLALEDISKISLPGSKIAISNPVFGTGATQAAAIYAVRGHEAGRTYYQSIVEKGIRIVDGNAVVRDLVVSGDVELGLTDTDDACAAIKRHAKVRVFLPKETVMIPATVAMVSDSPEARRLIDFLLGPEAERLLVESGFCQLPLYSYSGGECLALPAPRVMKVRPEDIVKQIDRATEDLRARFLK